MTAAQARERFAAARVARLATVAPDGAPRLVPIVFAVAGDIVYSAVDAKPKRTTSLARLRNVGREPRVCVLADHYAEDWSTLWWARADGRGRVLRVAADDADAADAADAADDADAADAADNGDEARRAIALLRARYPQQRVTGAVLAVDVTRWSGWAASGDGREPVSR